jgi:hypothetical protein
VKEYAFIRNPEKYFDRTMHEWHAALPPHWSAIDVDLAGFCKRCGQWLYIIEAAETDQKYTSQVELLAKQTGAVALLIVHDGEKIIRARRVAPERSGWWSEARLTSYVQYVRDQHDRIGHEK